jgi:glutamine synthetase
MLDDKTPLLRATDAVNREGLRLLKTIGGYDDVRQVVNYLGWEQEFFIISRENFLKRPDLMATGRTLIGAPPTRGQSMDHHYFGCLPPTVKACLDDVHAALLKIGCPLNVYHNEVAPAQHEISPFFTISSISADLNQIAMQICCDIGTKHGLVFLFHEKPFAGVNGSGKHNNWSVGTDTGINFFSPGKTEKQSALFAVGVACLTYALNQHGTIIRTSVAHAGNDHRLGAQEAPPAIVSLYPGLGFEAKIEDIVGGGELAGYFNRGTEMEAGCANLNAVERGVEDRNRTAPFPYVGNNRFEFRAVGSSQSCGFPMAMVNCAFADGMRHLNEQLESGKPLKECVAAMYRDNRQIIFCGNGYSAEWLVEAEKRGLPNLKDTVQATAAFSTPATKALFERMGVMSAEEVDSRQEVLYENYITSLEIEAATLVKMVRTGVEPATAADLAAYAAGDQTSTRFTKRAAAYELCSTTCDGLEAAVAGVPHGSVHATAQYMADVVKPHLSTVRKACDDAEVLVKADLWPFPSYSTVLYAHHFSSPKA